MIPKNDSHKESFLFFSRLFQGARICRCSFFLIRFFYQEFRHFYRENSIAARRTNARIPPPYPLLLAFVRCRILRNCVSNFVQNGFALNLEYTTIQDKSNYSLGIKRLHRGVAARHLRVPPLRGRPTPPTPR